MELLHIFPAGHTVLCCGCLWSLLLLMNTDAAAKYNHTHH